MEDLVLLRELIRTPGSNCFTFNINHVFTHLALEDISECVISRDAPPCNPIAIALSLSLLGVKPINARPRAGKDVKSFSMRYIKKLSVLLHLDVERGDFSVSAVLWAAPLCSRAKQAPNLGYPTEGTILHEQHDRCR